MNINGLIWNNPRAAFWIISTFWIFASVFVWGPLFSFLGYRVRINREPDETKRMRSENRILKERVEKLEIELSAIKAKNKAARMALA